LKKKSNGINNQIAREEAALAPSIQKEGGESSMMDAGKNASDNEGPEGPVVKTNRERGGSPSSSPWVKKKNK